MTGVGSWSSRRCSSPAVRRSPTSTRCATNRCGFRWRPRRRCGGRGRAASGTAAASVPPWRGPGCVQGEQLQPPREVGGERGNLTHDQSHPVGHRRRSTSPVVSATLAPSRGSPSASSAVCHADSDTWWMASWTVIPWWTGNPIEYSSWRPPQPTLVVQPVQQLVGGAGGVGADQRLATVGRGDLADRLPKDGDVVPARLAFALPGRSRIANSSAVLSHHAPSRSSPGPSRSASAPPGVISSKAGHQSPGPGPPRSPPRSTKSALSPPPPDPLTTRTRSTQGPRSTAPGAPPGTRARPPTRPAE